MSQLPKSLRAAGLPSASQQRALSVAPVNATISEPTTSSRASPMPGRLKKSDSIHFTDDTESFIVGDRVWVNGTKAGKIQFIGETKFAAGEWAGVVLDDASGKNDGSVSGVQYFQCEMNRGVFVRLHKLSRVPLSKEEIEAVKLQRLSAATSISSIPATLENEFKSPDSGIMEVNKNVDPSAAAGGDTPTGGLKVGIRVWLSGDRTGIVRFLGKPHFQEGIWAGIELDESKGKNDGSVEGQRYFSCAPNHGVFAPVAKVFKAPLPGAFYPTTPGRLKRSPSQESIHSNFSMQSTTSRRSNAIRLGMSSLSPSTVVVGRTGTGTAADIVKAHQEKDALISSLTRERDLARKELNAKSNQERDVHIEIQKLQEQYVDALSAQDCRIAELSVSMNQLAKEKEILKEQLDDEKKKVEDLQFRLEEELMAKETESQSELHRLMMEKDREMAALKSDFLGIEAEIKIMHADLQNKDVEVDRWRSIVEGSKHESEEIAEDRNIIAFEVADLNRQMRDLAERHRLEISKLQQEVRESGSREESLRHKVDMCQTEIVELRQKGDFAQSEKHQERSSLQTAIEELRQSNEIQQKQLREMTDDIAKLQQEKTVLHSRSREFEATLAEERTKLSDVFLALGEKFPETPSDAFSDLLGLFSAMRSEFSNVTNAHKSAIQDAETALNETLVTKQELDAQISGLKAELAGKSEVVGRLQQTLDVMRTENDQLLRSKNADDSRNKETVGEGRILQDKIFETKRLLEDKSREVESLSYQFSELSIELGELKSNHQESVIQSQNELTNVFENQRLHLERLMQHHTTEIGDLTNDFAAQKSVLESRLTTVESELRTVVGEKTDLHAKIGKFIEVLQAKDIELKETREHIEQSFALKHEENLGLSTQLAEQKEKAYLLEQELALLNSKVSTRETEISALADAIEHRERDLCSLRHTADEIAQKCATLELEAEQNQAAYAEQMMRAEVRREDDLRAYTAEKTILAEKVFFLEKQNSLFSANSSLEVDTIKQQFVEQLSATRTALAEAIERRQLLETESDRFRNEAEKAVKQLQKVSEMRQKENTQMAEVQQQLSSSRDHQRTAEQVTAILKTEIAQINKILEQRDHEIAEKEKNIVELSEKTEQLRTDSEAAIKTFHDQLSNAKQRAEELQGTVTNERNILNNRILDLEQQLSTVSSEESARLQAERGDFIRKLESAEAEIANKTAFIASTALDLTHLRTELQKHLSENNELISNVSNLEKILGDTKEELKRIEDARLQAETKAKDVDSIQTELHSAQNLLLEKTRHLITAEQSVATLTAQLAGTQQMVAGLKLSLEKAKQQVDVFASDRSELEKGNSLLESQLREVHNQISELTAAKGELDKLRYENTQLQQELETERSQQLSAQSMIEKLEQEIIDARKTSTSSIHGEVSVEGQDDKRTIDAMLSREVNRVKSEISVHRKMLEQKDSELLTVRQQSRKMVEQKDSEIAAMRETIRKEKLQKVHILNSIVAEQQNKIMDLEKKLQETSKHHPTPPPADGPVSPVLVKRRAIRLYCGICQDFDLHDTKDCTKPTTNLEKERKPKPPRPRRKYCDECELFDQHESEECPVLKQRNPPRVPLKPTGLIPS